MKTIVLILMLLFTACSIKDSYHKRVALIIGNKDYPFHPLKNPINDARDINRTFYKVLKYDKVIYKENIDLKALRNALKELKKAIIPHKTIVFIYFAGHGNTIDKYSENIYLQLISKKGERKVLYSIYRLYDFLKEAKAEHNIIAIDACRNYKSHYVDSGKVFRGEGYTSDEGVIDKEFVDFINSKFRKPSILPPSTLLSTAASNDQRADDISNFDTNHSPYARQLLRFVTRADLDVDSMFKQIRKNMEKETKGEQMNQETGSMTVNVYIPRPIGGKNSGITY